MHTNHSWTLLGKMARDEGGKSIRVKAHTHRLSTSTSTTSTTVCVCVCYTQLPSSALSCLTMKIEEYTYRSIASWCQKGWNSIVSFSFLSSRVGNWSTTMRLDLSTDKLLTQLQNGGGSLRSDAKSRARQQHHWPGNTPIEKKFPLSNRIKFLSSSWLR